MLPAPNAIIRGSAQPLSPKPTGLEPDTPRLGAIKAVVFDVYGTLIISGVGDISLAATDNRGQAVRDTLEEAGISIPDGCGDLWEAFRQAVGDHQDQRRRQGIAFPEVEIRNVWRSLLQRLNLPGVPPALVESMATRFEMRVNPVWPMPHLAETLKTLRERGLPMGIISNAQFFTPLLFQVFLHLPVAQLGFDDRCNVWSYAELEGKPSQALYRAAAEKWRRHHGLQPADILYVGNDVRNDIWPAREVGFKTALFAGDARSLRLRGDDPDCKDVQANWVVTGLDQIPENLA